MSSLVEFLNFEGEESSMFENNRLPTLDTELWIDPESGLLKYCFFEKKMCPNRVLQRTTALSSIRASLTQECIRRLKNCSFDLAITDKQEILSVYIQKLKNSGHLVSSSQYLLVHGVVKFLEMVRRSHLQPDHKDYKPLPCERDFDVFNRKLKKIVAKATWYESEISDKKLSWRRCLPAEWVGDKPDQVKVHDMRYGLPSETSGMFWKTSVQFL